MPPEATMGPTFQLRLWMPQNSDCVFESSEVLGGADQRQYPEQEHHDVQVVRQRHRQRDGAEADADDQLRAQHEELLGAVHFNEGGEQRLDGIGQDQIAGVLRRLAVAHAEVLEHDGRDAGEHHVRERHREVPGRHPQHRRAAREHGAEQRLLLAGGGRRRRLLRRGGRCGLHGVVLVVLCGV
jgi:hypothetical protein